ncbi:MAG: hypothetical protein RB191_05620 [Terriglobia bacterium]|nr:hypothetical protein [Terriglobia bacterium]
MSRAANVSGVQGQTAIPATHQPAKDRCREATLPEQLSWKTQAVRIHFSYSGRHASGSSAGMAPGPKKFLACAEKAVSKVSKAISDTFDTFMFADFPLALFILE